MKPVACDSISRSSAFEQDLRRRCCFISRMGISCGWGPCAGSCGIWWIDKKMATNDLLSRFRLTGKRALITGAGGGIGRALVALFQAAGASVMGADIRASAMDGLELDDRLVFDLTDPHAIEAAGAPLGDEGKG